LILENNLLSPEFPGRPKTAKGAIIALRHSSKGAILDSDTTTFIFQYNPEMLTRTISSLNGEEISLDEVKNRDANSIVELITLNLELDAANQLEQPNQHRDVIEDGLHPALAALESIMYSQSKTKTQTPPVVLFLWGSNRIIPVWLDSLKVTEEAFDPNLNPIRVKIELSMRLRNLSEFKRGTLGYAICASHLDHRRMFTRLYNENRINRGLFGQVSRSIRQYSGMEKSKSKKQNKKMLQKTRNRKEKRTTNRRRL
jgi:hypothetical protein